MCWRRKFSRERNDVRFMLPAPFHFALGMILLQIGRSSVTQERLTNVIAGH